MTAIQWLEKRIQDMIKQGSDFGEDLPPLLIHFEQANQMFEQQIIDAFDEGQEYEYQYHINNTPKFDSQTYFTETYGSKGSETTSSQTISDEMTKIEKALYHAWSDYEYKEGNLYSTTFRDGWLMGIDWYKKQIK